MKQAVSGQSGKCKRYIAWNLVYSTFARRTSLLPAICLRLHPNSTPVAICSRISALTGDLSINRGDHDYYLSTSRRTNRRPGYLGHPESKLDADCLAEFKNYIVLACVCKLCQNCRERRASDNLGATASWLASLVASHELIFEADCFNYSK